jgi:hypothetical protein
MGSVVALSWDRVVTSAAGQTTGRSIRTLTHRCAVGEHQATATVGALDERCLHRLDVVFADHEPPRLASGLSLARSNSQMMSLEVASLPSVNWLASRHGPSEDDVDAVFAGEQIARSFEPPGRHQLPHQATPATFAPVEHGQYTDPSQHRGAADPIGDAGVEETRPSHGTIVLKFPVAQNGREPSEVHARIVILREDNTRSVELTSNRGPLPCGHLARDACNDGLPGVHRPRHWESAKAQRPLLLRLASFSHNNSSACDDSALRFRGKRQVPRATDSAKTSGAAELRGGVGAPPSRTAWDGRTLFASTNPPPQLDS